jgi:hypothetical protein
MLINLMLINSLHHNYLYKKPSLIIIWRYLHNLKIYPILNKNIKINLLIILIIINLILLLQINKLILNHQEKFIKKYQLIKKIITKNSQLIKNLIIKNKN